MKKLILSFLNFLLLGFGLTWAQVTVSGTITVQGDTPVPSDLKLVVGKGNSNGNAVSLPADSYSVTVTDIYPGYNCFFALGDENALWGDNYRSSEWVFVDAAGKEVNPLILDATSTTLTADLVIKPKGGGGGAKATLLGTVKYVGSSSCEYGVNVAISGDNYSASTTTDYGDSYNEKLGCAYGYKFENLALGTYTLTYSKENYVTQTQEVTITEADEMILAPVALAAKPAEYLFEGYIKYVDVNDMEVKVEGAKVTAYNGAGENASVVGDPVYTDANGYWSMTVECMANATLYFFAEHPNIVVNSRKAGVAVYTSGNNVEIPCTEKLPDLYGMKTYKVRQSGTMDEPHVDISWTWPQELLNDYKTSAEEGIYQISRIIIKRPVSMSGLTAVGVISLSGYDLPPTSFTDGLDAQYRLAIGKTYKYTMEIEYRTPLGSVEIANNANLTITLTSDLTQPDSVTLLLTVNDEEMGTVSGAGKYEKNDMVVVKATPKRGYLFEGWYENGNKVYDEAEKIFTLTQDRTLEAVFVVRPPIFDSVTLTLEHDATMGTVTGAGRYPKGEEVTVVATPKPGYAFKRWKCGTVVLSTKASYTFIANTDSTITAVFERQVVYRSMINSRARQITPNSIRLTWNWPQELVDEYKKEDGTGIYQIASVNIKRRFASQQTPDNVGTLRPEAYQLPATSYTDCSSEYPLVQDTTYIYFLEVIYDQPGFKTVSVNGDGTDPRLSVKVLAEVAPIQYYTLTLDADEEMGTVSASGSGTQYMEDDEVTVTATPKPGYLFQCWKEGGEEVSTDNPYKFFITRNRALTAVFRAEGTPQVPDSVMLRLEVNDASMGAVLGEGKYAKGKEAVIQAFAKPGHAFKAWMSGNDTVAKTAEYKITLVSDSTLTAVFAKDEEEPVIPSANEDVEQAAWSVYAQDGQIVLRSDAACRYDVYNMAGVLVKRVKTSADECRVAVDNSGVYIVRRISATGVSVRKVVVR